MSKYLGITIGPIFETIMMADTPAKLWLASSVFSDLTRRLCQKLTTEFKDQNIKIISPYYSQENNLADGVGKYHDRIICQLEDFEMEKLDGIIQTCKSETLGQIIAEKEYERPRNFDPSAGQDFIKQYLQVNYVILEVEKFKGENILLAISPYLDAMELMQNFPTTNKDNVFAQIFEGKDKSQNYYVKHSKLLSEVTKGDNQLINPDGEIWDLASIAYNPSSTKDSKLKKHKYYAVVSADGDGMGRFLNQLGSDVDTLNLFSKTCLNYTKAAAGIVKDFGGMTIYAGGDDLLFLAPVENNQQESILNLCQRISQCFKDEIRKSFKEDMTIPTISFGIAVQYIKFPLYEAFQKAYDLLAEAKKTSGKNCMAFEVQKHSGQRIGFNLANLDYDKVKNIVKSRQADDNKEIHAIIYRLGQLEPILKVLDKRFESKNIELDEFRAIWMNFFDNESQKSAETYIGRIGDFYYQDLKSQPIKIQLGQENYQKIQRNKEKDFKYELQVLEMILRYKKFLEEKLDEREAGNE